MKRALEKGADPDVRLTWEGDTLAADAVLSGWPEAAELLLDAGANPEHEDICGRTSLQRADSERMRQLLDHYCVNPRR